MNSSVFSLAVDEAFPNLDEGTRTEIKNKVLEHMIEMLKEKAYASDAAGLEQLQQKVASEQDQTKKAELYVKQILERFSALPEEDRTLIDEDLEKELTRVMHEIYKAYE